MSVKHDPIHQPQLWEAVAERLRARSSAATPAGARLNEVELAERFGTSRGPVREATRELAREGSSSSCRGGQRRLDADGARPGGGLCGARGARAGASKVAVERASDAQLHALGAHLDRMERAMADGDWLAADNDLAFHRALVALAGNGRMSATYEQMLAQTLLLLGRRARRYPPAPEMPAGSTATCSGLVARDRRGDQALDAHYRHAEDRLFSGLD